MIFKERLPLLRKERNLSQFQLAEKLSVSEQTVRRWEAGKSVPDSNQLEKMCEVLAVPITCFLDGDINSDESLPVCDEQLRTDKGNLDLSEAKCLRQDNRKFKGRNLAIVLTCCVIVILVSIIVLLGLFSKTNMPDETTIYYANSYSVNWPIMIAVIVLSIVVLAGIAFLIHLIKKR